MQAPQTPKPPPPSPTARRPEPEVTIRGLPPKARQRLGAFFTATSAHERVYWLLVAMIRHHAVRTANAVAFDLFLALIPMLGLAGWVLTHLLSASPEMLAQSSLILDLTPSQLHGFLSRHLGALSAVSLAPIAVVIGWWLSSSAFYTAMCVFEETFECKPRAWAHGRLISLGFALVGMVVFVLLGVLVFALTLESMGLVEQLFGSDGARRFLHAIFALGALVTVTTFLAFLYRYSIRRPDHPRRVWAGALVATLLGSIASVGLGYYASNIARYSLFYGGLAVVVVLLLWLWLWSSAVLLGAELNIALEDLSLARKHRRAAATDPTALHPD